MIGLFALVFLRLTYVVFEVLLDPWNLLIVFARLEFYIVFHCCLNAVKEFSRSEAYTTIILKEVLL